MLDLFREEQDAQFFQLFYDHGVGLEDVHPREEWHVLRQLAFFVHRRIDVEAVFEAGHVVLFAVPRRDVDRARAHVLGHIVGEDDDRSPVDERMPEREVPSASPERSRR